MSYHYDAQQYGGQGRGAQVQPLSAPLPPAPIRPTPAAPHKKGHLMRNLALLALLVVLLAGGVSAASLVYTSSYQLYIRIGNQQPALVDLRLGTAISPDLLGANVFPQTGSSSQDEADDGFMSYDSPIINGLLSAHIKLLRFPGGNWGEAHTYSLDQLNAFSTLLDKTQSDGLIQAQLTGPNAGPGSLASQASAAGLVVDYMNNKNSTQRSGAFAHAPFHPVAIWTVGNEPDLLTNPDTDQPYTADQYANAFIQFSIAMHQIDPTIKVFGPEISQFDGVGIGPRDANGKLWMEEFLLKVSSYEQAHPALRYHLLDGVSFHRYPLGDAKQGSAQLLRSTNDWSRILPSLRQLIRQDFRRDIPIALTEVNTNTNSVVPPRNLATVWWADTLGQLMDQHIGYVAFFSAEGVDTPYPLFTQKNLSETSMLRVMQLFAHLQQNYVPVQVGRNAVSMYATTDDAHQTVSLLFVNKSAASQQAQVAIQQGLIPVSPWPQVNVNLGPYSIMVITLHRNGGSQTVGFTA